MAIRIDAAGDALTADSSFITATSFTVCGWAYVFSNRGNGANQLILHISDEPDNNNNNVYFAFNDAYDGDLPWFGCYSTWGGQGYAFSTRPDVGKWWFWFVRSQGQDYGDLAGGWKYKDGTDFDLVEIVLSNNTVGLGPTAFIGRGQADDEFADCALADVKFYDHGLTYDQLHAQAGRYAPVDEGLISWHPLASLTGNLPDRSGQGNDFTAVGSLSVTDGPPLPWTDAKLIGKTQISTQTASATIRGTGIVSAWGWTKGPASAIIRGEGGVSAVAEGGTGPISGVGIPTVQHLWGGSGAYLAGPTELLTTELDGLSTSSLAFGSSFSNSARLIFTDIQFFSGSGFSPGNDVAFIEVWLLRSIDGGQSYEDGSGTVVPGRDPDAIIDLSAASDIVAGASGITLPPGYFRPLLRNRTGASLPATGNVLKLASYTDESDTPPDDEEE